jgi:hypothetical protein
MEHYIGHQQALIKDNLVIAVLVFNEHDPVLMYETFQKFDYDEIVDLCKLQKGNKDTSTGLGFLWDGKKFHYKPFNSWILGEDAHWHAPIEKPEGDYIWNEENISWELRKLNKNGEPCITGECE